MSTKCARLLQEQQAAAAATAQADQRAAQLEELLETVQGDLATAQGAAAALEGRLLAAESRAEALVGEHAAALAAQEGSTAARVEERVQARVAGAREPHHLPMTRCRADIPSGLLLVVVTHWEIHSKGWAETPHWSLMIAQDSNMIYQHTHASQPLPSDLHTPVVVVCVTKLSLHLAEQVQSPVQVVPMSPPVIAAPSDTACCIACRA